MNERKGKGQGITQTPWTLRVDNENYDWLLEESERTGKARGRIINDMLAERRNDTPPAKNSWKQLEKRLRNLQLQLSELAKDLGGMIDESKVARDYDDAPDTLNSMMDERP